MKDLDEAGAVWAWAEAVGGGPGGTGYVSTRGVAGGSAGRLTPVFDKWVSQRDCRGVLVEGWVGGEEKKGEMSAGLVVVVPGGGVVGRATVWTPAQVKKRSVQPTSQRP